MLPLQRLYVAGLVVAAGVAGVGCRNPQPEPVDAAESATEVPVQLEIAGAGPGLAEDLVATWAPAWTATTGHRLSFRAVGNAAAVRQVQTREADFAIVDAPLSLIELDRYDLHQFPVALHALVPVVHLPGAPTAALHLDAPTLTAIYLGEITSWDDARIAALNPDLPLPATPVIAVHRADEAGTTWVLTDWLSKVSPVWRARLGRDRSVAWTTGVGVKEDAGVADLVARVPWAVGVVPQALADRRRLKRVVLVGVAGDELAATEATVAAAALATDWRAVAGFGVALTDASDPAAWPLSAAIFALVPRKVPDAARALTVLRFFASASQEPERTRSAHATPLPEPLLRLAQDSWSVLRSNGVPVWQDAKPK
ncbi:MAG: phosphate ABC transporter substrate-binding protein PstS [Myxococcales bacterium]|nr:phosphate ABC transporter substrate-binding protein PstS [Myxococcales bacterium]